MTVKKVLKQYSNIDETTIFLSHLLKCSTEALFINSNRKLTKIQLTRLSKMLRDFTRGLPAAYIIGYKYFFGFKFRVNKNVLIPRPESEWLVEQALEFIHNNSKKKLKILDLGTGSGCLAISIAKYSNPTMVQIYASDISAKALTIAKQNAKLHGVRIKFTQSDLLSSVKSKFDLIIANLPYVPIKSYKKLYSNLKYEPILALTDGTNNFLLYRKLADQLLLRNQTGEPVSHNMPKLILSEIDPKTKPVLTKYVKQYLPNSKIKFERDLQELWRYAILES